MSEHVTPDPDDGRGWPLEGITQGRDPLVDIERGKGNHFACLPRHFEHPRISVGRLQPYDGVEKTKTIISIS